MCNTCQGYGFWAIGHAVPMYRMDAEDGLPTIPCPECGANKNPFKERSVPFRSRKPYVEWSEIEKKIHRITRCK